VNARQEEPQRVVVVDSSIGVKWFKPEDERGVDIAWDLLEQHRMQAVTIAVPGHFTAEVLNGLLWARCDSQRVREAAGLLHEFDLVPVSLTRQVTEPAVALALSHRLTINDALFPALAVLLRCKLVTADRAQARVTECPVRLVR
jgi:predicted nucleic acid-binding protein